MAQIKYLKLKPMSAKLRKLLDDNGTNVLADDESLYGKIHKVHPGGHPGGHRYHNIILSNGRVSESILDEEIAEVYYTEVLDISTLYKEMQ